MKKVAVMLVLVIIILLPAGCIRKAENTSTFKGVDEAWEIQIPNTFVKDTTETDSTTNAITTTFKSEGSQVLYISEVADPKYTLDENTITNEVKEDSYLKLLKTETQQVGSLGVAYGGLIEDTAIGYHILYYKIKIGDKVISVMDYSQSNFTTEQEANVKVIVSSIKKLK